MTKITIGADPELFVQDNGKIIPVCGMIDGDKANPLAVKCGAIQEDNVLAEFNIDPVDNVTDFKVNLQTVMDELSAHLKCDLAIKASHHFDQQTLMSYPSAMILGCEPDFNAYTKGQNKKPNARTTLRTAGGHIHVGYENNNEEQSHNIVKNMDILLGLPSVLLDDDTERRAMYGAAGAHRIKPYGVEYRSLSNFWLGSERLQEWAYEQSVLAVGSKFSVDEDEVQRIINDSDVAAASAMIQELGVAMP